MCFLLIKMLINYHIHTPLQKHLIIKSDSLRGLYCYSLRGLSTPLARATPSYRQSWVPEEGFFLADQAPFHKYPLLVGERLVPLQTSLLR